MSKIKDYFNAEFQERKIMSKRLTKYVAIFIILTRSGTSVGISIISFTVIIGVPVRIASASFSLSFSLTSGILKDLLKITVNKKKKRSKIVMLAGSKLNIIEKLIS